MNLTFAGLDGEVLWSLDPENIGQAVPDPDLYSTVKDQGTFSSQLQKANVAGDAGRSDIVRTYFPVRDSAPGSAQEGKFLGALFIDQDVTASLAAVKSDTLQFTVTSSIAMGALLFGLLFLIILRADRIIDRWFKERKRTEEALQETNRRLETALEEPELREGLANLIFNAVDAMPEGGVITIGTVRNGDQVEVEINDTGKGMSEEVRLRCLDPFFTTKGNDGTGMGLAMVYGIADRHDGTIDIKSAPGKGTTFSLRLPVTDLTQVVVTDPEAPQRPTRSLQILAVDDEPAIRRMLSEYLSHDGHTVETACDGREGLEMYRAGEYDLVVTDQAMPELAGDQMAAAIKDEDPEMPVIMLTGFGEIMKARGDLPTGIDVLVSKPVTLPKLLQAVATVTAKQRLSRN